jgi:hypothetical protein
MALVLASRVGLVKNAAAQGEGGDCFTHHSGGDWHHWNDNE